MLPIVAADYYRDAGPSQVCWERRFGERFLHGCQRRLRTSITVREAEIPVFDLEATSKPLVGPRKDDCAGAAGRQRGPDLPFQGMGLGVFAVTTAVQTYLTHKHRPVTGNVVQSSKVGLEGLLLLKVDIERDKVEEG